MPVKWIVAIMVIYLIGVMLGSTFEKVWTDTSSNTESLASIQSTTKQSNIMGTVSIPTNPTGWYGNVVTMATMHYQFFQTSPYDMVYYFIIMPFIVIPGMLAIFYVLYLMLVALISTFT